MKKKKHLKKLFLHLFIFGCARSSLLAQAFSLVAEGGGSSLVPVHGLPIAVASAVAEQRL